METKVARSKRAVRRLFLTAVIFMAADLGIALLGQSELRADCVLSRPCIQPRESATAALQDLLDGNSHFVLQRLTHPRQNLMRVKEIAPRQNPFAVILSCSDSRLPPEIIFDQGLGDLFVIRLAGNVASEAAIFSIVFGVTHLGARLVIVLGHDRCGAVTAAVDRHEAPGDDGPLLLDLLLPAVEDANQDFGPFNRCIPAQRAAWISHAVDENVALIVNKLLNTTSAAEGCVPAFQDLISTNELLILGARYKLNSGRVLLGLNSH